MVWYAECAAKRRANTSKETDGDSWHQKLPADHNTIQHTLNCHITKFWSLVPLEIS